MPLRRNKIKTSAGGTGDQPEARGKTAAAAARRLIFKAEGEDRRVGAGFVPQNGFQVGRGVNFR